MKFGSLFAGVGGFDLGMERAGMECRWQVEINPFRRKVLETHWPKVKRYEDIQECGTQNLEPVDLITAGVPCQDWSVAGRRAGLKGKRSGLFFEFARILQQLRPTWFVFENVPGLFSSNGGRDFATVQSVLMEECGYGVSWRVLNSQFFGVAQRRRRVYVVGYLGAPCPAQILFECPGGRRNSEAGKEAREDIARTLTKGSGVTGNPPGRRQEDDYNLVYGTLKSHRTGGWTPEPGEHLVASTLTSRSSPKGHGAAGPRVEDIPNFVIQDVRGGTRDKIDQGQGIGIKEGGPCYTLSKTERHGVAFSLPLQSKQSAVHEPVRKVSQPESQHGASSDVAYALRAGRRIADSNGNEGNVVVCSPADPDGVRNPGEGYPCVAYTIPSVHRGIGQGHNTNYVSAPADPDGVRNPPGLQEGVDDPGEFPLLPKGIDSPRYQALGDAVSVPVAEWIGNRIVRYEKENNEKD